MSEYQIHDYSGVVHPGLRKAMEGFEPFLARVRSYPVPFRSFLDPEVIKSLEANSAESNFLLAEAQREGVIKTDRDPFGKVVRRVLPTGSLDRKDTRVNQPKVIELDDVRAFRALVWGYAQAGTAMDNAHNLTPAVETGRAGLGPDSIAQKLRDPRSKYYFDRVVGRPMGKPVGLVETGEYQLEDYEGVNPSLRTVIDEFESNYKPASRTKYSRSEVTNILKTALDLDPTEALRILQPLLNGVPLVKIIDLERVVEMGRRVEYYDPDGLRLMFGLSHKRKSQLPARLDFKVLVTDTKEAFGGHRLAEKILPPQGNAYK